jgi:hypothetical protein
MEFGKRAFFVPYCLVMAVCMWNTISALIFLMNGSLPIMNSSKPTVL